MKTAGMWPWKQESSKERVTAHLPNELALKMDGAKVLFFFLYLTGKLCYFSFSLAIERGELVEFTE